MKHPLSACIALISLTASASDMAVLEVQIDGIQAEKGGSIRCAVFDEGGANGFPSMPSKAVDRAVFPVEEGTHRTRLRVPGTGTYAVSCTHDANDNEKLDTNFLGIPKEGWGVSRGVRPAMRAPRFEEAKFELEGAKQSLSLSIGY